MNIKYFKNSSYKYTSRKRFRSVPSSPFATEEQKSVLLGDGANTTIKTRKENICDYVMIDSTRWFVTSYTYLNGKQVQLNLQRDVIGEFGVSSCFGKIERGYTASILKYRKELDLNQILKERKYLIPNTKLYGNYAISTHEKEMWGILYLVKPTGLNPNTGEKYPDKVNINIPAFAPEIVNLDFIPNGTKEYTQSELECYIDLPIKFSKYNEIIYIHTFINKQKEVNVDITIYENWESNYFDVVEFGAQAIPDVLEQRVQIARGIGRLIGDGILRSNSSNGSFTLPDNYNITIPDEQNALSYNNVTIKKDDKFYHYTVNDVYNPEYGRVPNGDEKFNFINTYVNNCSIPFINTKGEIETFYILSLKHDKITADRVYAKSINNLKYYEYVIRELSALESGSIVIDTTLQLVDEPYNILVFPLFDCTITKGTTQYNIDRKTAFMIFNTVIQYLSGENPYLIDAQIYPYCPILTSISTEINNYPFFTINSTTYEHNCTVQLLPNSDVKREYIEREYSIISPEQSSKFTFNFYDYTKNIIDYNGKNYASLNIVIKTALKPFAIISSAVIQPSEDSLMGITYNSDLRGCKSSSNGFECSLSSNAFETYKRQNSNYQEFFDLDKKELSKQHQVELVNDSTQTVVNTLSSAAMGALAGGAMMEMGLFNTAGTSAAGAIAGAATAGGITGAAMITQTVLNNQLRELERDLQQQRFDLKIGTVKNLPDSVTRISSFNEIIMKDFWYVIEVYECSDYEKSLVDDFINKYGYGLGVFGYVQNFISNGWFIKCNLITSNFNPNLQIIAKNELSGGIYLYE